MSYICMLGVSIVASFYVIDILFWNCCHSVVFCDCHSINYLYNPLSHVYLHFKYKVMSLCHLYMSNIYLEDSHRTATSTLTTGVPLYSDKRLISHLLVL